MIPQHLALFLIDKYKQQTAPGFDQSPMFPF